MAISGLYFVFFVLFHMYGNLKILYAGVTGYDEYAHHLRTMFEPILPYQGFLWIFRMSLILAIIVHVWSASQLWRRAKQARPVQYAATPTVKKGVSTLAMRWGGVALLLFIVFHLLQFTVVKFNVNTAVPQSDLMINGVESPGKLLIASFQVWWLFVVYAIALLALGVHLNHGTWSAIQTLGWTNTAKSRAIAKTCAMAIAVVVVVGFLIPPFLILVGVIK
ncbi:hypothetical protein KEM60_01798 [Austwickia sp. TVS 96-490-7B]|nr:hypothetical protein [Austwickia sp. TVS 96-490-7B]